MTKPKSVKKISELNLTKLFPSLVTMAGICVGLSAIRFALDEKWEMSVSMVLIAAIIDAVDGKLARALNATSTFGGHLDSLSDFINFGFVPSFLIYLWSTNEVARFGWAGVLFFTVCCAIRLARFNTDLEEDDDPEDWQMLFFKGVPSPAGALICLGPMMLFFSSNNIQMSQTILQLLSNPYFLICYTAFTAFLMASKIPTYSLKKVLVKKRYASLLLVLAAACLAFLMIEPWITVLLIGLAYISLIPFSAFHYLKITNAK